MVYYFVIQDSEGMSRCMLFKIMFNNLNQFLFIIVGGDFWNNWQVRVIVNCFVSKLCFYFVIFNGDMIGGDINENWCDWFDDWQEIFGSDGWLFLIVVFWGNYEWENVLIIELFDVFSIDVYYVLIFGGDFFCLYIFNLMIVFVGSQAIWLEGDLDVNQQVIWKMVQYYYGMCFYIQ